MTLKQDRKDRLNQLRAKLAGLTEAEKEQLTSRGIIATIEGRTLSLHNTFMVYLQSNGQTPTVVGGYKQWLAAGRQVQKGQHGLSILFPAGSKDKDTGDILEATHFYAGTVFDISQTEPIGTEAQPDPTPRPEPRPQPEQQLKLSPAKEAAIREEQQEIKPTPEGQPEYMQGWQLV